MKRLTALCRTLCALPETAWVLLFSFLLAACAGPDTLPPAGVSYDIVLTNGRIVDGTGEPAYRGDVAIRDGKIAALGDVNTGNAASVVDVNGYVIAPGFIDVHSHADLSLDNPATRGMEGYLRQGVTTAVYGVDGFMGIDNLRRYIALGEARDMGINFMSYIGHNAMRRAVMGMKNRAPNASELQAMKAYTDSGMALGAVGLSTGLMYLPGNFATAQEVIELAKVVARYDGIYDSHIRDPANNLLASVTECLDIALAAGVAAHPAHLKAVGAKNFGNSRAIIDLITDRIAAGEDITVDVYPYDGAATAPVISLLYPGDDELGTALRRRMIYRAAGADADAGDAARLARQLISYWRATTPSSAAYAQAVDNTQTPAKGVFSWVDVVGYQSMRIVVSDTEAYRERMVIDLAEELGITPFELFRRLIVAEGETAMVTLGAIQEWEVRALLTQPWAMVSSDGVETDPQHPRGRGAFARVLGRYVRQWNVMSLEQAIYKMSGLPARFLKLDDRGVVRKGAVADLTVFDPDTIIDRATWSEPQRYSSGVIHVLIDGSFAVQDGELTGRRLGRFIPFDSGAGGSQRSSPQ